MATCTNRLVRASHDANGEGADFVGWPSMVSGFISTVGSFTISEGISEITGRDMPLRTDDCLRIDSTDGRTASGASSVRSELFSRAVTLWIRRSIWPRNVCSVFCRVNIQMDRPSKAKIRIQLKPMSISCIICQFLYILATYCVGTFHALYISSTFVRNEMLRHSDHTAFKFRMIRSKV